MGIQGLLAFLRNSDENLSAIKPSHLSKFRGKKAAIDAYSWLHKGVFCCANDLFLNKPTKKYVEYCLKNLKLLQDHDISPILVFDGGRMPFKVVEQKRREDRQKAKQEADDLIAAGRMNEAYMQMVQSINITHQMAANFIKAARQIGVESVVAPYEADAQLVYLEKEGLVDFIISEDSDLIVFGAQKVFLKMAPTGHGDLYDADCVELCLQANKRLKGKFTPQKLLFAAILSGCDYLKNLPGIGLIKAWKFMNLTENSNIRQFLRKVPSYLKLSVVVDEEYIEGFINAVLAFHYQVVFDTRQMKRVPLRPLDDDVSMEDYSNYLNRFTVTEFDHLELALGNIDNKNQHYDSYHPHMMSYLYYGVNGMQEEKKPVVLSPVIGFNVDGVYRSKSARKSKGKSQKCTWESQQQQEAQEDEDLDLANYYRKMDTSPRVPALLKAKEDVVEQPRKRIKCKFLKYKTEAVDIEPVHSRFFKTKSPSDKDDIPKENITKDVELSTSRGAKDDDDEDLTNAFKVAGVELISDDSNDSEEFKVLKQEQEQERKVKNISQKNVISIATTVTPVKDDKIDVPVSPESPVITSQVARIKPKLKEIQNVQKFARVKKKIIPKNQPTLLGFFTKL